MSSILKGIQLNEVNPHHYDSDWDYQDAVANSGRPRFRSSDSYDAFDAENDAYEMHKRFAATRARKEAEAKAAAEKAKTGEQGVNEAEADYGPEYQAMVQRVGQRAKELAGGSKTVWDEKTRRYKVVPVNSPKQQGVAEESKGLWANIHAKQERIKHGSGEHMRKPGSKGAPTADALRKSAVKESSILQGLKKL